MYTFIWYNIRKCIELYLKNIFLYQKYIVPMQSALTALARRGPVIVGRVTFLLSRFGIQSTGRYSDFRKI